MEYSEDIRIVFFLFAGTVGMLALSFGIILFVIVYQRKVFAHNLKLHEMETYYHRQLVQTNMDEVENERIRISKDLHDEIGSLFSAVSIKLDQLENAIEHPTNEMEKVIKEGKQTIDQGIKSIRRISHNMLPASLEMFGLTAAIEDLCAQFDGGPSGLPVDFYSSPDLPGLPHKKALILYRIAQELIHNTIKHSAATHASLKLLHYDGNIVFEYGDNGKGFVPNKTSSKRRGIGLLNLESRVNIMDAVMLYTSSPGEGMYVKITIPY